MLGDGLHIFQGASVTRIDCAVHFCANDQIADGGDTDCCIGVSALRSIYRPVNAAPQEV